MMITLSTVRYLCGWAAASFSSLFFLAAAAAAGSAGPFDRYQTAPPAMAAPNTATAAMMMTNFIFFIYALLPLGLHGKGGRPARRPTRRGPAPGLAGGPAGCGRRRRCWRR